MHRPRWFAFILLTGLAVLSLSSAVIEAADLPPERELNSMGLEVNWLGQAVLNTSRDEVRYVANDEDVIVVQSTAGVVTVFNAEDGRRRWAAQVGRSDEYAMPAVLNDRFVLVVAGPVVHGLDKFSGEELFQHRMPLQPSAGPAITEEFFYVPLTGGALYAYSLDTMQQLERYGTLPSLAARPFIWRFISGEEIVSPPTVAENIVAFVTSSSNLHLVNTQGRSEYQFLFNGTSSAALTSVQDPDSSSILTATGDNQLYSVMLTRAEGARTRARIDWRYPLDRTIIRRPVVIGQQVLVVTDGGGLYNISRQTGRPVPVPQPEGRDQDWYVTGITSVVSVSENHIYGIDLTNRLTAIDRATSQVKSQMHVDSYRHRHQNDLTDRLYLVSNAGEVLCLREPGSEFAVYHQNPSKRPISVDVPDEAAAEAEPAP